MKDMAIRVTLLPLQDGSNEQVSVSVRDSGTLTWRALNHPPTQWTGERLSSGRITELFRVPSTAEMNSTEPCTVELRMVGDVLTLLFNGKVAGTVRDSTPGQGDASFKCRTGVLLKKVERADFGAARASDAAAKLASVSATETKDSPFVNTLGQEFVPVPGMQVLFCRWETRVKDYAEFAKANKVDTSWTQQEKDGVPASREPEHPVAGLSPRQLRAGRMAGCAANWKAERFFEKPLARSCEDH